jgi:hypothetical protein
MDELVHHAQTISRPTTLDRYTKIGDRPWNDPGTLYLHVTHFLSLTLYVKAHVGDNRSTWTTTDPFCEP